MPLRTRKPKEALTEEQEQLSKARNDVFLHLVVSAATLSFIFLSMFNPKFPERFNLIWIAIFMVSTWRGRKIAQRYKESDKQYTIRMDRLADTCLRYGLFIVGFTGGAIVLLRHF